MNIEEFVNSHSTQYISIFHPEKNVQAENKSKKSTLDKVSKFLFQPRYEVNNLKFKSVTIA